jgi:hypothetical protein
VTFFGIASLSLLSLVWLWDELGSPFGPGTCFAIATIALIVHLMICGRRLGAFDPGIWIPVILYLHYFGMVVAVELIPDSGRTHYDAWLHGVPNIDQGFATALLTTVAFLFGFHLTPLVDMGSKIPAPSANERSIGLAANLLLWGGILMVVVGIPVAGVSLVFGHYGEMKEAMKFASSDFRLIGAGFIFATGGLAGVIANARRLNSGTLYAAFGAAGFIILFLSFTGDRTGLSVVGFAWGWALTQRLIRIPRWPVVAGFIAMILMAPMIKEYRVWRNLEDTPRLNLSELAAATFYEMGSSVGAFCWTINKIPSKKNYDWGMSFVAHMAGNIPNFGVVGQRFIYVDPLKHKPSMWVTWTADPVKYWNAGGGLGFAVGAEWYFNFGFPGVLIGMAFLGWLTAWSRNKSRDGPIQLLLASMMIVFMANVVRNDFGYPLRAAGWPLIGYFLIGLLLKILAPRGAARARSIAASYDPDENSPHVQL